MFEYFQNATRVRVMLVGTCASQDKMLVKLVYEFVLLVNYVARARVARCLPRCCQVRFKFFSLSRMSARCLLSANVIGQGQSKEEFFPVGLKCTSN